MRTYDLAVSAEEVSFLANGLPAGAHWPEPYDSFALSQIPGGEVAGGPAFRLKVIALNSYMRRVWTDATPATATLALEVTEGELWFLDYFLNTLDYSKHHMAQGTPIFTFAKKVWALLLESNIEKVDPRYLPGAQAQRIATAPEEMERQRRMLAEMDGIIEGAERTATGEQYAD